MQWVCLPFFEHTNTYPRSVDSFIDYSETESAPGFSHISLIREDSPEIEEIEPALYIAPGDAHLTSSQFSNATALNNRDPSDNLVVGSKIFFRFPQVGVWAVNVKVRQ